MRAKITLVLSSNDPSFIEDLKEYKRQIECGEWQRDIKKTGVKVKITFEYLDGENSQNEIKNNLNNSKTAQ